MSRAAVLVSMWARKLAPYCLAQTSGETAWSAATTDWISAGLVGLGLRRGRRRGSDRFSHDKGDAAAHRPGVKGHDVETAKGSGSRQDASDLAWRKSTAEAPGPPGFTNREPMR